MTTKLIELRPDKNLINADFNGYKLSLETIPVLRKDLVTPVDKILPISEQYSLLHTKLFALHNFLFVDQYSECEHVYFIDGLWNVQKVMMNEKTGQLRDIGKVWQVPKPDDLKEGRYNLSMHFASNEVVVVSDGNGMLHIVNTGKRNIQNEVWNSVYSDEVLDSNSFTVIDAVYTETDEGTKELHCILNSVERNEEKFCTVVNWVTLNQTKDSKWGAVSLKVLKGSGQFYYCALERNCKYLYIASDKPFTFVLDSENPIVENMPEHNSNIVKVFTWLQTADDVTLRFNLSPKCNEKELVVSCDPDKILIKYKNIVLLQGELKHRIDSDLTNWSIANNLLEVLITKTEAGLMWTEFVIGDETGEQIMDPGVVAEVHQRLAHLCSETEVLPSETGSTYSSQQTEECDFAGDDTALFERICASTHNVTHRINLGTLQLVTTVSLNPETPPVLALRHDVDACLWQPLVDEQDWSLKHEGTLYAFGYVQASKEQKKFTTCSIDLSYSVVCESTRHVFIYRQSKPVMSGELRNRKSGQNITKVGEQQVVSFDGENEILGIYAAKHVLYLLTQKYLLALKMD